MTHRFHGLLYLGKVTIELNLWEITFSYKFVKEIFTVNRFWKTFSPQAGVYTDALLSLKLVNSFDTKWLSSVALLPWQMFSWLPYSNASLAVFKVVSLWTALCLSIKLWNSDITDVMCEWSFLIKPESLLNLGLPTGPVGGLQKDYKQQTIACSRSAVRRLI